jgi:cell fate (sporulation/competence/biofilm development) regulator YlbF (YheA/YmcA/DUF963 family)
MTQSETAPEAVVEERPWRSDVERAARELAAALAETPEFGAFERTYLRFRDDEGAQEALWAYQVAQRSLQPLLMLGAAGEEQRAELERLRRAWAERPSVSEYLEAQSSLSTLCHAIEERLSEHVGLGFAAACNPSCCG